ncbi:MAG: sigma-70 family RNA polymerase sigma factor [Myxococcaceae bacterium]|nr:sigma-70 family RNA polymerase sigma factor [Myxococcaceae bacterium]
MGATADQLTELYRRYAPAVFRRARSLLAGDEAEANDVVQEVFLAYVKNQSKLRGEAQPFTILYQMATYQSVDRLRRSARWSNRLTSLSVDEDAEGPALQVPSRDDGAARLEAARDLALLTEGEDEQTLTCALLYFVEAYTTEEIAQSLGISRKTVGRALAAFAGRAQKRAARLGVEGAPA